MVSDEAYATLLKHKRATESFSDVIKRLAPLPIGTFGDLQRYLEHLEGPLLSDGLGSRPNRTRVGRPWRGPGRER
ncbi:MAG TPA: antitoxin VapB family protein [Verrucomicrobiae bacterium]|nr:antitoxin VapB family protein [Verrucomicrobiae bacterium]